jgi:DNA-binding CsgD family transcriptional regulator
VSAPSLLERERELRAIDEKLDEAAVGRGGLVLIEGPAGIGKSALVARARRAALDRNVAVASARGSELERADAFGVVRQLLEPRLRGMSASARERLLGGAAALAAPVVLPETAPVAGDGASSFAALHGLYWLVAGLAAERPQLLAVDDLHWADEASVRFLLFLANRLEDSPVLLLAAQRPDPSSPCHALRAAPGVLAVTPGALSITATAAALGDGVEPEFAAACHAATGGNPLLVRRLGDGLREHGVPFTRAGVAELARSGPDVVSGTVTAAMERLGREPVALARAVAILGDDAPLALAAALAGLPAATASAAADQLVRAGILEDGLPLRFQHALVRDAVLGSLTAGERAAAHRDAARLLAERGAPPRAIALHLRHTEPDGDPGVAATLAAEGRRALASGAPSEARELLARALAEPPAEADRHGLLLALSRASTHLGDAEAIDHIQAAYDAAGDEVERAHAALAVMWATGPAPEQIEQGLRLIEPAIEGMAGHDRELGLQLQAARLMMLFLSEDQVPLWIAESERHATLEGSSAGECLLLLHAAIARFATGRPAAEIAAPVERIPGNAAALAALGPEAPWLAFLIGMLFKTDRLDAAAAVSGAVLAEASRTGSAGGFAIASVWLAWIALRRGEGATAEAHARAAVDAAPAGGWQHALCSAGLAEVLAERAQLDEAARILAAVGVDGLDPADRSSELAFSTRSIVRTAQGDAAGALEDQLEARRRRGDEPAMDPDFAGWLRIARLLHATGDAGAAREEAVGALEYARHFGTPGYIGQALTVTGVLAGGAAGIEVLREAVEQLEGSPARCELARSLVDLGGALRRDGQRVAARDALRRALDIAAAGGLTATAERAREELRATGARVRRDHATGVASLTPSELRIAERAAAGASNPEIAQALFVTTKTVEMHLSRVYRKLDIPSRDRLPAALSG